MPELPAQTPEVPQVELPGTLALLPVRDLVLFPYMIVPLLVAREVSASAVDLALGGTPDRLLFVTVQRSQGDDEPRPETLNEVGTVGTILRMRKLSDGRMKILIQGLLRARVVRWQGTSPCFTVRVEPVQDTGGAGPSGADPRGPLLTAELDALRRQIKDDLDRYAQAGKVNSPELVAALAGVEEPGRLADLVCANLQLSVTDAQALLEELEPLRRLRFLATFLRREIEVLQMQERIQSRAKEVMSKSQREHYLREQIRQIQTELGVEGGGEAAELRRRIEQLSMSGEALAEAERQLRRLESLQPQSAEYQVVRTHLEWIAELPWQRSTKDQLDLAVAKAVLDEDHYDLARVKDRILEYLSVLRLRVGAASAGPLATVLCFVGPPGVGKTSLGRSIARALGRRFVRVMLGGVRDDAEIRGHRRTYVGALPGRLLQGLRQAGTQNPVVLLDEIDKLVNDHGGDPAAALLEVLDPEQNHSFRDHYLSVPFDLSQVLFIATANSADRIPQALRDRLELIELSGYSDEEKLVIARTHVVPRALSAANLERLCQLRFGNAALQLLIRDYTREAGLRELERQVAAVCRKVARQLIEGEERRRAQRGAALGLNMGILPVLPPHQRTMTVTPQLVRKLLGPAPYARMEVPGASGRTRGGKAGAAEPPPRLTGTALGLAWTPVGGEVLEVETQSVPGGGRLTLTGHLGEIMRESAQTALSYARAQAAALGLQDGFFADREIHIHVPAGSVPKDGPSAGVTMACALVSLLTGIPAKAQVAMTGELSLRGRVLPVGGIREKLLAARRAGIAKVLVPRGNRREVEDIPEGVLGGLQVVLVATMEEVLKEALSARPVRRKAPRRKGAPR